MECRDCLEWGASTFLQTPLVVVALLRTRGIKKRLKHLEVKVHDLKTKGKKDVDEADSLQIKLNNIEDAISDGEEILKFWTWQKQKCLCFPTRSEIIADFGIAWKTKEWQDRVQDIDVHAAGTNGAKNKLSSRETPDSLEIVGMKENIDELNSWLLTNNIDECLVIAVYFQVKELQRIIAEKVCLRLDSNSNEEADRKSIYDCLQGLKFLLVLDDVWSGKRLLERIGVPVDKNGCRIVVTTRMAKCQLAERVLGEAYSKIVKKCGNLPLAIKTAKSESESQRGLFKANKPPRNRVVDSLASSYDALPPNLRRCFLYCSAFPEHSEINAEYLIQMWIAEGFVDSLGKSPKVVVAEGRRYLDDLVDRSLIQVSRRSRDGRVKSCNLHEMIHALGVVKATEKQYMFKAGVKRLTSFEVSNILFNFNRVSLIATRIKHIADCGGGQTLRTLLLSDNPEFKELSASFISHLEQLRVLDLSSTSITSLPRTLSRLRSLELLNLRCCNKLKCLPAAIGELEKMKHLDLSRCTALEFLPYEIGNLTSLQTLEMEGVWFWKNKRVSNALKVEHLKSLTQLSRLNLNIGSESGKEKVFGGMLQMRSLKLQTVYELILPQLPNDMESMKELEVLHLIGPMQALPRRRYRFQHLTVLILEFIHCMDYLPLETIPKLEVLKLKNNENCREFRREFGKADGFPSLQRLTICDFKLLCELPVLKPGAMPKLRYLRLARCPRLRKLSRGVFLLSSLEAVSVFNCTKELDKNMEEGASDRAIILKDLQPVKIKLNKEKAQTPDQRCPRTWRPIVD
eukprot:Gb_08485 [translate_table: standard]